MPAAAPAASAFDRAVVTSTVLAQDETVTSGEDTDKNNDGFTDVDPTQPWPFYVLGVVMVGAAIFVTVKLFRG